MHYPSPSLTARIADLQRQERIAVAVTWQRSSDAVAATPERAHRPPDRGRKLANAVVSFFSLVLTFLVDRRAQAAIGVALAVIAVLLLVPEQTAAGLSTSPSRHMRQNTPRHIAILSPTPTARANDRPAEISAAPGRGSVLAR